MAPVGTSGELSGQLVLPEEKAKDIPKVVCVIRDETSIEWRKSKIVQNLQGDTTIKEFFKIVSVQAKYVNGSFLISYLKPTDNGKTNEEIILDGSSELSLDEVIGQDRGKRSNFLLKQKDDKDPESVKIICQPKENDDSSPDIGLSSLFDNNTSSSMSGTYSLSSSTTVSLKSDTGFVGLINQAMTCYLNSLLQTLFMTPEFRNALYRWKFVGNEKDAVKSIPFQLQKLFLNLQTSNKRAVETTDLTKSFGWDSSEAWQQHDVQELCRVMFDALELTLKDTDQADLINQLYEGKLKDYVECLKCFSESAREDTYLDIPLAVRPYDMKEAYSSVEDALTAFATPEILDGNNQYFCDKCNSKQDAHKGLKFLRFPYLLTIQLKRFTFDYSTMQRIKLHDRVTFSKRLNLKKLLEQGRQRTSVVSCDLKKDEEMLDDEEESIPDASTPLLNGLNDTIKECVHEEKQHIETTDNLHTSDDDSNDYELFSIMIHSGSALGGHYYAFIRSFADGRWYCFNDQYVSEISGDDIKKSFGGLDKSVRGYYSSTYASSTNAYMLMYRKVNPSRNTMFLSRKQWPDHIKCLAAKLQEDEEEEANKKEMDRNTCKIRLFCKHPENGEWLENRLEVHKEKPLKESTAVAWKLLDLEDVIALDRCRIIKYDDYYGSYERSYEGEEATPIGNLLGGVRYSYAFDLLLETRAPDEEFPVYEQGGITVKLHIVDLQTEEVDDPPIMMHVKHSFTVNNLKQLIHEKLSLPLGHMRLALGKDYHDFRSIDLSKKSLKMEGLYKSAKVFIEAFDETDYNVHFLESKFFKVLEKYSNTITITVSLPFKYEDSDDYKEIDVKVDKRNTLGELKRNLEKHVGVESDKFRVYRVYSNNQEFETTRLNDSLTAYVDETKIVIKLGRALKPGESRIKLYFLRPNEIEHTKFLLETVVASEMTIKELKAQILPELRKDQNFEDIPPERIRIRKKSWKSPARIYTEQCAFGQDISVSFNMEFFLEITPETNQLVSRELLCLFIRRWKPSDYTFLPFEEIILESSRIDDLKEKLSRSSGIPKENIEIAKGRGFFPCDISVLEVHKDLEWNAKASSLGEYPLSISDDGAVIYYRDKEEDLGDLTEEKRKEIKEKERKRMHKGSATTTSYTRKEKALKINIATTERTQNLTKGQNSSSKGQNSSSKVP